MSKGKRVTRDSQIFERIVQIRQYRRHRCTQQPIIGYGIAKERQCASLERIVNNRRIDIEDTVSETAIVSRAPVVQFIRMNDENLDWQSLPDRASVNLRLDTPGSEPGNALFFQQFTGGHQYFVANPGPAH